MSQMTYAAEASMFFFHPWSFLKTVTHLSCTNFPSHPPTLATLFCPLFYYPADCGTRHLVTQLTACNLTGNTWTKFHLTHQHITQEHSSGRQKEKMIKVAQNPSASCRADKDRPSYTGTSSIQSSRPAPIMDGDLPTAQAAQELLHSTLITAISREVLILPQGFKQTNSSRFLLSELFKAKRRRWSEQEAHRSHRNFSHNSAVEKSLMATKCWSNFRHTKQTHP